MIYLNNSTTSFPKPDSVTERVLNSMKNPVIDDNRSGFVGENDNSLNKIRIKISSFFGINDPSRLIFTQNATEAINTILSGLELKNKNIITTVTEHNCVLRKINQLKENNHVEYINCDKYGFINIKQLIEISKSGADVAIINHSSNVTGAVQNIEEIYHILINENILPVFDISQTAGVINIDIKKMEKAFFVFTGHKSLFGITGSGGFYIPEEIDIKPFKYGGNGIWSDLEEMPSKLPYKYEAGTHNIISINSLCAGIDFINSTGIEKIHKVKKDYIKLLYFELSKIPGIEIFTNIKRENSGILSFRHKEMESEEISDILFESFKIIVRSGLHCAPLIHKSLKTFDFGLVRVSPSIFNTESDICHFIESLKKISILC